MTYYFDPEPEGPQPDPYEQHPAQEAGPRPWFVRFADPEAVYIDRTSEIMAARDHRWTGRAILVAALILAVLNSAAITSWASALPPSWATETIRAVSQVWSDRLSDLGLDQPRTVIRDSYEAQKAKRWG